MHINNWNSSNYIPFNQQTGKEYRQFLQQRIKNQQIQLDSNKAKLAKCNSNSQFERNEIAHQINQIEYDIDADKLALKNLEWDLKEDAKLDEQGLFGSSILGKSISAIAQAIALPVVAALNFVEAHPIAAGVVVLALQTYDTLAAPLMNAVTINDRNGNASEADVDNSTLPNWESSTETTFMPIATTEGKTSCLQVNRIKDVNYTSNHKVLFNVHNNCNTVQHGHVVEECGINGLEAMDTFESFLFSLPPNGNTSITAFEKAYIDDIDENGQPERIYLKKYDCSDPVKAGYPLRVKRGCLRGYLLDDGGNIIRERPSTYKMINICNQKVIGHVESKCQNGTREFELEHFGAEKNITLKHFGSCSDYIQEGQILKTFEERFCKLDIPKTAKIVGGSEIVHDKRNHLAYVLSGKGSCTGTFLNEKHVLTAAHCVTDEQGVLAADQFRVKVGASNGPTYKVVDGFVMKAFLTAKSIQDSNQYDLALLELAHSPKEAIRATLPDDEVFCEFAKKVDKILATDVGYPDKALNTWNKNKNTAAWSTATVVAQGFGMQRNAEGTLVNSYEPRETELVIAYMPADARLLRSYAPLGKRTGTGFGDSGGPFFYKTEENKLVQLGVLAAGDTKFDTYSEAVNTHHPETKKWIQEIIDGRPNFNNAERLKFTCATSKIQVDGFSGLFTGSKKITLTNHCRFSVKVSFADKKTVDMEAQNIPDMIIPVGQTRVFYGKGVIKPIFTEVR